MHRSRLEVRMQYRFFIAVAALLLTAAPALAQGQMPCGDRDELLAKLKAEYKETPAGFGMTGGGQVVELLTSEKGSWTLLLSLPNGRSCLIGSGEGWELRSAKKTAGRDA
ncbi:MAG: hypothetical protein ACT4N4_02415 [Rhodospirillales bacterium]